MPSDAGYQVFLPSIPLDNVHLAADGGPPATGEEMLVRARKTIAALLGQEPAPEASVARLVTVTPDGERCRGELHDQLVDQQPQLVDQLPQEIHEADCITSVILNRRTTLKVPVHDGSEMRLRMWLTLWMQNRLYQADTAPSPHGPQRLQPRCARWA